MTQDNVGRAFMRATYYENMPGQSDQEAGLPQPPLERPIDPGKKIIPLTKADRLDIPPTDLRAAIEGRLSVRAYANSPLTEKELSWLLWATQGVRKVGFAVGSLRTYRNVPSAGGRHPFETWLVLRAAEGFDPGIYRFLATEHALQEVSLGDYSKDIVAACRNQIFIEKAAVTFIWAADAYRAEWRYRARAWRGILQDAGHVCQNLYLAAAAVGCGVCGIGAFDDLILQRLLGIGGADLIPAYAATAGRLKK